MSSERRRTYDHRIREAIVHSGDISPFPHLNIPDTTRRSWLRRGTSDLVTIAPRCTVLRLRVVLNHLRLGQAAFGGGGEMWSEDNCEFSLYAFLDRNDDGELDIGEPAGRVTMDLSCFAAGAACHELVS